MELVLGERHSGSLLVARLNLVVVPGINQQLMIDIQPHGIVGDDVKCVFLVRRGSDLAPPPNSDKVSTVGSDGTRSPIKVDGFVDPFHHWFFQEPLVVVIPRIETAAL